MLVVAAVVMVIGAGTVAVGTMIVALGTMIVIVVAVIAIMAVMARGLIVVIAPGLLLHPGLPPKVGRTEPIGTAPSCASQYHHRSPATKFASLTSRPSRRAISAVLPNRRVQEMPTYGASSRMIS